MATIFIFFKGKLTDFLQLMHSFVKKCWKGAKIVGKFVVKIAKKVYAFLKKCVAFIKKVYDVISGILDVVEKFIIIYAIYYIVTHATTWMEVFDKIVEIFA